MEGCKKYLWYWRHRRMPTWNVFLVFGNSPSVFLHKLLSLLIWVNNRGLQKLASLVKNRYFLQKQNNRKQNPIQMSYYQTPIKSCSRKQARNYTQDKDKPTDWICMVCNNLNFSFRKKCNRCKTQTRTENQNQIATVYSDYYYSNHNCYTSEKRVFADLTNCQTPDQKYQQGYSQRSADKIMPFVLCQQSKNHENNSFSMNDIHSERKLQNVSIQQFSSDKLANQQWNKFQTELNEDQIRTSNVKKLSIDGLILQQKQSYNDTIVDKDTSEDSEDLDIEVQIERCINNILLDDE